MITGSIDRLKAARRIAVRQLRQRLRPNPRGFYVSVQDWLNQPMGRTSSSTVIYPAETLCRRLPQTIDPALYWKFSQDYEGAGEATVTLLPRGRVWGDTAVITPDRCLLSELSRMVRVDPAHPVNHPVFHSTFPALQQFDGNLALLSTMGANTYFHWMIDLLPRIHLLQQSPAWAQIDAFLVNGLQQPFQRETLELLGIPLAKVMAGGPSLYLQARQLILPSQPRLGTCGIGGWVFDYLRQAFLPAPSALPDRPKRLYISRSQASRRRVVNEAEVIEFLERYGFEPVSLETLSVQAQIQEFAAAEAIVAPHGAGLTNLVFAPPGAKVVEIYSPNYVSVSYWNISAQVGLEYGYLFGEGERPPAGTDPHILGEDISVNLADLKRLLGQMGIAD